MSDELPDYYFRARENGAAVFKVDTRNRLRRIDFEQIAVVNIRSGEIRPQGETILSDTDMAEIQKWVAQRKQILVERDVDDIFRAMDHLNYVSQWAQTKATPEQLESVTDQLLMSMHDLRNILVRKKADRAAKSASD